MAGRQRWAQLKESAPHILPSMLLCDFGNLAREMDQLTEAGVPAIHLDVMDGQFVPNLTYGMPIVAGLRKLTDLPLDVHLMIENPGRYVRQFHEAGADLITIHQEATGESTGEVLAQIRDLGAGAGIAINPDTPLSAIEPYFETVDLVLIMSVNAGFGGQSFNPIALEKLQAVRQAIGPEVLLEVDGGVNQETIASCVSAGADLLVVGSAIFGQPDYRQAVADLKRLSTSNLS
ncbi:MAG: ribulose-phosphate 3-epimerase [Pirellulaceae bacterium]